MSPDADAAGPLDRSGPCPQCGATLTFAVASSAAQVCPYCRFLVARTDRDYRAIGRVGELVTLPTLVRVGATGAIAGRRFRAVGRAQYDRAGAASAPWQELYVTHEDGSWSWLAFAEGRVWLTSRVAEGHAPIGWEDGAPGATLRAPDGSALVVVERGQRRMISGEGELPFVVRPGEIERYLDLSGPGGVVGTLDLGEPAVLYVGATLDPSALVVDPDGELRDAPAVGTGALACPSCGGAITLVAPAQAARVVCPYCRTLIDVEHGVLEALVKVPAPPTPPEIPLGARGRLHGADVTCIAFLARSCAVEGEVFAWREYLLWDAVHGFQWLVEDGGAWTFVRGIAAGDVGPGPTPESRLYKSHAYHFVEQTDAHTDYVLGELYWKATAGDLVRVTTFRDGTGRTLTDETTRDETTWSWAVPIEAREVAAAFGLAKVSAAPMDRWLAIAWTWFGLLAAWALVTMIVLASRSDRVVWQRELAAADLGPPGTPEAAIFSEPFEIEKDKKNLAIALEAPGLDNGWIAGDVALVEELDGTVVEGTLSVEHWSGVSDGESWSEGSRTDAVWFSRVPVGRYVVRFEPEYDAGRAPPLTRLLVRSDSWRGLYVGASLAVLVAILGAGTYVTTRFGARSGA